MKLRTNKLYMAILPSLILVACNTTGSSGSGDSTAINVLEETLKNNQSYETTANRISVGSSTTPSTSSGKQLTVSKNATNGYDFTIDGKSFTVTESDYNSTSETYEKTLQDNSKVSLELYSDTGNLSDYKYSDFLIITEVAADNSNKDLSITHFGQRTTTIPSGLSTASYSGDVASYFAGKGANNDGDAGVVSGKISLTADFNNGIMSGNLNSFRDDDDASIPGQINLSQGKIANNAFTADLAANATMNTHLSDDLKGSMEGNFYGDSAEETAGTFILDGNNYVAAGGFASKQN